MVVLLGRHPRCLPLSPPPALSPPRPDHPNLARSFSPPAPLPLRRLRWPCARRPARYSDAEGVRPGRFGFRDVGGGRGEGAGGVDGGQEEAEEGEGRVYRRRGRRKWWSDEPYDDVDPDPLDDDDDGDGWEQPWERIWIFKKSLIPNPNRNGSIAGVTLIVMAVLLESEKKVQGNRAATMAFDFFTCKRLMIGERWLSSSIYFSRKVQREMGHLLLLNSKLLLLLEKMTRATSAGRLLCMLLCPHVLPCPQSVMLPLVLLCVLLCHQQSIRHRCGLLPAWARECRASGAERSTHLALVKPEPQFWFPVGWGWKPKPVPHHQTREGQDFKTCFLHHPKARKYQKILFSVFYITHDGPLVSQFMQSPGNTL